jgi:hypothetical protein
MQVALFKFLSPFVLFSDAFQDDIGPLRFIKGDHFHAGSILQLHQLWKEGLADFALKLAEVVGDCDAVEFPLHLAVDPVLEAARVHEFASALTVAGTNQRISLGGFIA